MMSQATTIHFLEAWNKDEKNVHQYNEKVSSFMSEHTNEKYMYYQTYFDEEWLFLYFILVLPISPCLYYLHF